METSNVRKKVGRPKVLTPEELKNHWEEYKRYVKANPFLIEDWVGAKAVPVIRKKERPITLKGFEVYCYQNDISRDLTPYITNRDGAYAEFIAIVTHIKAESEVEMIDGAAAGIYNQSIVARKLGLTDKVEQTQIVHTINLAG